MSRIRKDFRLTSDYILSYIQKYIPEANYDNLKEWENDGSLEYKIIDGKKYYFNRAHTNLFRINKEAKNRKELITGVIKDNLDEFLESYIPEVISTSETRQSRFVKPLKVTLNYTLTIDSNAVPPGEIIRAWLPYPREGHERQSEINFVSANTKEFIIAGNENQQRTIYMEKIAEKNIPTVFNYSVSYLAQAEYNSIDAQKVKPYDKTNTIYKEFTAEREPHILFTDKIKTFSRQIVQDEKNPYLIARRIFYWIHNNIPWAGAREYSTIRNISDYCISTKHGDCGIKTLLFMTLCRYNGIPVKWQSGWMLHPGSLNLHDWAEIYFEGYGWVPADQSFGLVDSEIENEQFFFLGSTDSYHLIINDDYSAPLFPAKIFPRSETVDFQRGEVEWRGGNLYFDMWDYDMEVSV